MRDHVNPRQEAFDRLGGRYEVRVLEPSPPAVSEPPYVDDQVARGEVPAGRELVSPVSTGDLTWSQLASGNDSLAAWCSERWLAAYPRLHRPPTGFAQTRDALHRLAEHVISPTRQRANGEITLRFTRHGFGTPFFGNDVQLRVERDNLVLHIGEREERGRITSLKDAAEFVGFDLTRTDAAAKEDQLPVTATGAAYLGDVYGFAFSVLEELRARAGADLEPSLVNLWPEHFDVAVELGSERKGQRAGYGVSPGDEHYADPYVYVSPWAHDAFEALPLGELLGVEDQRGAALAWLGERLDKLTAEFPQA